MNTNFYLLLLLLIPALSFSQANPDRQNSLERIPHLTLESVRGKQINLSEVSQKAIVLFLLPKPQSMSEGKKLMEGIRRWMDRLRARYDEKVYALLIVEPLKTSFPFYNFQKGKLKKEFFPIVIDKHGEILQKFGLSDSELRMLIVDKELKIWSSQPGRYSNGKEQEIFNQLEGLVTGNSAG
jgi:hypothetical protein